MYFADISASAYLMFLICHACGARSSIAGFGQTGQWFFFGVSWSGDRAGAEGVVRVVPEWMLSGHKVRQRGTENKGAIMRRFWRASVLAVVVGAVAGTPMHAETDIALSGYGAFTQSTTASNVVQHPASQGGYLVELRHISNPIEGFKLNYGFNRANQLYTSPQNCTANCTSFLAAVPADAHEVTAEWVVSLKVLMVRPFAYAGGGLVVTVPQGSTARQTICGTACTTSNVIATTKRDSRALFTYGAGLDFSVLPHVGFRFQYRGRVSKAPDLLTAFSSTNRFARTSEPVFGVFLSF
jgi:opacity protein-like surface antigen